MEVSMFHSDLNKSPVHNLPTGYVMRPYESGDIRHWLDFHIPLFDDGIITENLFWNEYGQDEVILAKRQFYMMHNTQVIGTISAWFGDDERGKHLGRIHWVVLRDDYRGRGLSKPLLSFACQKLKQLGHEQAYLITHTELIPAISLYLKFGFLPEINSEQDKQGWHEVHNKLAYE